MLRSMTGFGRSEVSDESRKLLVEIKSVNHRYCDISIKMPKKFAMFEASLRSLIKTYTERGKIDVFITSEEIAVEGRSLIYNRSLAAEYVSVIRQMQEDFGLTDELHVSSLLRIPDVITVEETAPDEDKLWELLKNGMTGALTELVRTRKAEGEKLRDDLLVKLDELEVSVSHIEERSPEIIAAYKSKLTEKVRDLLGNTDFDENRIVMETTIYADKLCVDEEIVRLKSHIDAARKALCSGESVGRRLDFLAQEMNREANTILSKANDIIISDTAIELKTCIEKIREQIQNIE